MRPLKKSPALVLRVLDHGESDKIITFFSPAAGRLSCIAKGAKRSSRRFVNKLELFTRLDIVWAPARRGLHRLDQAELVNPWPWLRSQPSSYGAAGIIAEQALHWIRENDSDPALFNLCEWALAALQDAEAADRIIIFTLLRIFDLQGYRPQLDHCLFCHKLTPGRYSFLLPQHGIACGSCRPRPAATTPLLSLGTINLLRRAMHLPMDRLSRLRLDRTATDQALLFVRQYAAFLLQRDLAAWKVYEAFRQQGSSR